MSGLAAVKELTKDQFPIGPNLGVRIRWCRTSYPEVLSGPMLACVGPTDRNLHYFL